jgi:group I intron endonuclease
VLQLKLKVEEIVQTHSDVFIYNLLFYEPSYLITNKYYNYNNQMFLKSVGDEYSNEYSNQFSCSDLQSNPEPEQNPDSGPEDPDDDDFVQKTVNNNNLITVKPEHKFSILCKLDLANLKATPASPVYNFIKDRETILKEYKNQSGIYLLHNDVNGKQYVGSGMDLGKRLATYYFPSRLIDSRYISNSILKYGHGNFSGVILYILGKTGTHTKTSIIRKEQQYINLYKPVLNLNPTAGSSTGFKHSEESKRLISEYRKGKALSENTNKILSVLFSGELNPFLSKFHSPTTIEKMRESKVGRLNPMFNKKKSKEFIAHMNKDRRGSNNPMFGKIKSEETLAKLSKKVYVYDNNRQFIICYDGVVSAVKDLHIAAETIKKYINTDKLYKNKYFYSEMQ